MTTNKPTPNRFDDLVLFRFHDLTKRGIVPNRVTLGRWIEQGSFPRAIQIGPRSIAWRAADIETWLRERSGGEAA